jgi:ribonuclease HI
LVSSNFELFTLNQALELLEKREETIYTDPDYTFRVVHMYRKIWTEQGLINSKEKDIVHKEFITQVLKYLMKPEEIAVVHIP